MGNAEGRDSRPCPDQPQGIWRTEQAHRLAAQRERVPTTQHQQAHLAALS